MGVEYRVERGEVHPGSVRWKRRVSERTVGDDTQVWGGLRDMGVEYTQVWGGRTWGWSIESGGGRYTRVV